MRSKSERAGVDSIAAAEHQPDRGRAATGAATSRTMKRRKRKKRIRAERK
jgi:hypothetical protein